MLKVLILTSLLAITVAQFNYCSLSSQNTLCLYKPTTIGSKCMQPYAVMNVTAADKNLILQVHNNLRRKVAYGQETRGNPGPQPPAANMRELTWDDELATMAQTWAQQCTFAHDVNRNVARFRVGQNIAILFSPGRDTNVNWSYNINMWYNEVDNMDRSYVNSFPYSPSKGVIGHYTQVVWADTYKIGCGIMSYFDKTIYSNLPYKMFYVCNYGPAGNYYTAPVYKTGPAASACPTGTVPKNGLCA